MYNLGYDIGSSTVKIALVDAKTNHEIDVLTHPKEEMPIYSAHLGWAEQDPELWWSHLSADRVCNCNVPVPSVFYDSAG